MEWELPIPHFLCTSKILQWGNCKMLFHHSRSILEIPSFMQPFTLLKTLVIETGHKMNYQGRHTPLTRVA